MSRPFDPEAFAAFRQDPRNIAMVERILQDDLPTTVHLETWHDFERLSEYCDGWDCALYSSGGKTYIEEAYNRDGEHVTVTLGKGAAARAVQEWDAPLWTLGYEYNGQRSFERQVFDREWAYALEEAADTRLGRRVARHRHGQATRMENALAIIGVQA